MPRPPRHYLDELSDDLYEWIEDMADAMVLAFRPGGRAPFAAQVTEQQKLAYYRDLLLNKDGSSNQSGVAQTLARVGPDGLVEILTTLNKATPPGLPQDDDEAQGSPPALPDLHERSETGVA